MINDGYAATQLINQLHELIIDKEDLSDQQKSAITLKLAVSMEWNKTKLQFVVFLGLKLYAYLIIQNLYPHLIMKYKGGVNNKLTGIHIKVMYLSCCWK